MRELIKTLIISIPKKIRLDLRISVDTSRNPIYTTTSSEGDLSTSVSLFPTMIFQIQHDRPDGEKPPWNKNDGLLMSKYTFPIFYNEFKSINDDMKIPELYSYTDSRLVLNEKLADAKRKVFKLHNTVVELSAVVIEPNQEDINSQYAEGIKIKFNNEASSTVLTLNEATSLLWNMDHLDIDGLALSLYNSFYGKVVPTIQPNLQSTSDIDIKIPSKFSNINDEI